MSAFQDAMQGNYCWGCGADNPDGLQLKSRWDGERSIAEWSALLQHAAGPRHFLNGGVITTLLDCHGVCTAVADAYRRAEREIGSDPEIWHATRSIEVQFLRPTPIDALLVLRGTVVAVGDEGTTVECALEAKGKERARARITSTQVPDRWRHGPGG